jgi:phage shock protein A
MDEADRILTTLLARFDSMQSTLDAIKAQMDKMSIDHSELRDRVTVLETRYEELHRQHCDRGARVGELEKAITTMTAVGQGKADAAKLVQWAVVVLISVVSGVILKFIN